MTQQNHDACSGCGIRPFERHPDGRQAVVFVHLLDRKSKPYLLCRRCLDGGPILAGHPE